MVVSHCALKCIWQLQEGRNLPQRWLTQCRTRHITLLWKLERRVSVHYCDCEILIADTEQHVLRRFVICSGQFSEGPTFSLPVSFLPWIDHTYSTDPPEIYLKHSDLSQLCLEQVSLFQIFTLYHFSSFSKIYFSKCFPLLTFIFFRCNFLFVCLCLISFCSFVY